MLQQGAALLSLGAAYYLGGTHHQIAGSQVVKTKQIPGRSKRLRR